MKRFLIFITALFYLASSTGAVINAHYCLDELVDWNLSHSKNDRETICGKNESDNRADDCCNKELNNCCKDESSQLTLEIHRSVAKVCFKRVRISSPLLFSPVFIQATSPLLKQPSFISTAFRNCRVPVYLFQRVFRI